MTEQQARNLKQRIELLYPHYQVRLELYQGPVDPGFGKQWIIVVSDAGGAEVRLRSTAGWHDQILQLSMQLQD